MQVFFEVLAGRLHLLDILHIDWAAAEAEAVFFVEVQHLGLFLGVPEVCLLDLNLQSNYFQLLVEEGNSLIVGVALLCLHLGDDPLALLQLGLESLLLGIELHPFFFQLEGNITILNH